MNRTKKISLFSLVAIVVLCLGLAACTPQGTDTGTSTTGTAVMGVEGPYISDENCMSCHGGTYEAIAALTAQYGDSNPHDPTHGGYFACNVCHEQDRELTYNWCEDCHNWPRLEQSNQG